MYGCGSASPLTLEEFDRLYSAEAGWEFWFGQAIRKPVPTWYHGILQIVLGNLLFQAGYFAGAEIYLKVDRAWQPRPDLIAAKTMAGPYPATPVDIVIEILSDDQFRYLHQKCQNYARIGISHVFVLDPEQRKSWRWSSETETLQTIDALLLPNGVSLATEAIWTEFEARIKPR